MANALAPFGLICRRKASGGYCNMQLRSYAVDPADATPLYIGDPIIKTGTATPDGVPYCTRATAGAGNLITGVVEGVGPESLIQGYRPASTYGVVLVNDDPDALFEVIENGNGGVTMASSNADLVAGNGNAGTRQSGFGLASSSSGTGATKQLKVVAGEHRADNDPTQANASWLVKINLHTEAQNTAGI